MSTENGHDSFGADPAAVTGLREGIGSVAAYAALGDSFTAGTGCPPGARWADRLAQALRSSRPDLVYRNLAEKGATTQRVLDTQVCRANQLEPALATVICGANDILETVRPDVPAAARRFTEIVERLRAAIPSVVIVSATVPELWHFLDLGPRTRIRVHEGLSAYNEEIREIAAAEGIALLEIAGHPDLDNPGNFVADGLHPSAAGHRRFADAMMEMLGSHLAGQSLGGGK